MLNVSTIQINFSIVILLYHTILHVLFPFFPNKNSVLSGSYAKVIQAEHKKTGAIYAIKIIKKQMFSDDEVMF